MTREDILNEAIKLTIREYEIAKENLNQLKMLQMKRLKSQLQELKNR